MRVKHKGVLSPELQGKDSGGATQSGVKGQGSKYRQKKDKESKKQKKMEMTEKRGRVKFR